MLKLSNMKVMLLLVIAPTLACAQSPPLVPRIDGDWWTVARDPDLGPLTTEKQQPVDFAIWQAADGSWQLLSCIRGTKEPGKTRLLFQWEGKSLTDADWRPRGIALRAQTKLGETEGGLQAPHVINHDGRFVMFYGDWENICLAESDDGKTFTRRTDAARRTGMFSEGPGNNTRDPMTLRIGELWHCYYTAYPDRRGAVFCRTSRDMTNWSEPTKVAFGGEAGTGPYSAECPFVVQIDRDFYLFRTQTYGKDAITRVYVSRDPLDFGIEKDEGRLLTTLPVAAPELIQHDGQWFIATLRADLKGIQIARLKWAPGATPTSARLDGGPATAPQAK